MRNLTSGKGLYHNMKNWKFEYLGDFKIMEQDSKAALEAFRRFGSEDLFNKLSKWDYNLGTFKINKQDYGAALSAVKQLAELEESNRKLMTM